MESSPFCYVKKCYGVSALLRDGHLERRFDGRFSWGEQSESMCNESGPTTLYIALISVSFEIRLGLFPSITPHHKLPYMF